MNEEDELKKLFSLSEKDYGDGYKDKLFKQYKIYLQMTDNLIHRRTIANNFFLSINTGLLAALGYLFNLGINDPTTNSWWIIVGSVGGILFAYTWLRIVTSYKQLSRGKWKIIHEVERKLPLAMHEVEWKVLGEGKDKSLYKPLTDVEKYVPMIFIGIYSILIIVAILIASKIITIS